MAESVICKFNGNSLVSSQGTWEGNKLIFNLPAVNAQLYELTAMTSVVGVAPDLVKVYFIVRINGISYRNVGSVNATMSVNGTIVTVELPSTNYWVYSCVALDSKH